MEVKITKLDNFAQGIARVNEKVLFVPKTLKDEVVDVEIVKDKTKYTEGRLNKVITSSSKRKKSKCLFFDSCSGCNLRHTSYQETLEYKKNKIIELFKRNLNLNINPEIIPSNDNYRNKVSLKVVNDKIGYFEEETNVIVPIDYCYNAKESINSFIKCIKLIGLNNGLITIRSNYNDELLINIETKDQINFDNLTNYKIVGIVVNGETVIGSDHFMEIINKKIYNVSINSFFQVNNQINSHLHNLITENISNEIVLDLYCGVGSLTIPASLNATKVFGVDNSSSNISDALLNAKMNNANNVFFLLGDASKTINKIPDKISTIVIDPPRKGLTHVGINNILSVKPNKIIYVSCDPITLVRDLKLLNEYSVKKVILLDMFPYTYHVESIVRLEKQ